MRVFLKISGFLLGLAAGFVALLIPIFAYVNVAVEAEWRKQHPPYIWGSVGYVVVTLVAMAIFSAIAYAFLRCSLTKPHSN